jgi:hypothetical protein
MNVKIRSIVDAGVETKERIVMKVLSDTDIGHYAVFEALRRGEELSTAILDAYWFPDKSVKEGDLVILYTKSGTSSEKTSEGGKTSHFFYWGRTGSKWGSNESAPALLEIMAWESFIPDSTELKQA